LNIINYGDLTFNGVVTFDGSRNINIVNTTPISRFATGQINMENPNARIYSNADSELGGLFSISRLDSDESNSIVLGENATLAINNLNNIAQDNPLCATSSCAAVTIGGFLNGPSFYQALTADSEIVACNSSGSGSFNPGNATERCPATCNTPLPITLLHFGAEKKGSEIALKWTTVSEQNNAYFSVERSKDGFEFDEIERIEGNGNHIGLLHYHVSDNMPLAGRSYYRLKQVDFDSSFEYSKVVSVYLDAKTKPIEIYPNPVTKEQPVKVIFVQQKEGMINYQVYDVLGKIILNISGYKNQGIHILSIPTEQLQKSYYFVKVNTSDGAVHKISFTVNH
jgi:hypothetical protein